MTCTSNTSQAKEPEGDLSLMGYTVLALVLVAFLPPVARTVSFVLLSAFLIFSHIAVLNL